MSILERIRNIFMPKGRRSKAAEPYNADPSYYAYTDTIPPSNNSETRIDPAFSSPENNSDNYDSSSYSIDSSYDNSSDAGSDSSSAD